MVPSEPPRGHDPSSFTGVSQFGAPVTTATEQQQPHSLRSRADHILHILAGGPRRSLLRYPRRFKMLVVLVMCLSFAWTSHYVFVVLPVINWSLDVEAPCSYHDNQLTYNAKMLFVYFIWFAVARFFLLMPCIAVRIAQIQSRTHGFFRTYCVHLVLRDGPLYIFVVGSMLFWLYLMQSPDCEERSPRLYHALKPHAVFSCMLSICYVFFAYWHNRILMDAAPSGYTPREAGAPADTILQLPTVSYDVSLFGDEDGKLYPPECAICLSAWQPDEVIKVTPCSHAFHEECIGNWLRAARTCALCRQDVTKPLVVHQSQPDPISLGYRQNCRGISSQLTGAVVLRGAMSFHSRGDMFYQCGLFHVVTGAPTTLASNNRCMHLAIC